MALSLLSLTLPFFPSPLPHFCSQACLAFSSISDKARVSSQAFHGMTLKGQVEKLGPFTVSLTLPRALEVGLMGGLFKRSQQERPSLS